MPLCFFRDKAGEPSRNYPKKGKEMDFEKIRKIRNRDNKFSHMLGVDTQEVREGYARGVLPVTEICMNINRSVHGGCLYTLADTMGGAAACSVHGFRVATLSGNIEYLRPAMDTKELTCIAEVVKAGKRINVCETKIYDDKGTLLVIGLFEYARLKGTYE